jgi:methionyl-tRNA formyltransferase
MTKEELRIIYMGTPDFAVESLRSLVEAHYNVVGVVTMPDKPIGRHGSQLQASPVKQYAQAHGIPVLQPERLKDEAFLAELRNLRADLQIVVAFRMLPEVVWAMPPLGTFNLHASLLPQYRGAAPINWAVINGETETGVTTFFLKHEIDTGQIIRQEKVNIGPNDNAGDIHDRLMTLGGKLVTETVDLILSEQAERIDQESLLQSVAELKSAPKIFHETCEIRWNQTAQQVHDFIRGLSPYPGAWSTAYDASGQEAGSLKIFATTPHVQPAGDALPTSCGSIHTTPDHQWFARCSDAWLRLDVIQVPGKKRMTTADYLRGQRNMQISRLSPALDQA